MGSQATLLGFQLWVIDATHKGPEKNPSLTGDCHYTDEQVEAPGLCLTVSIPALLFCLGPGLSAMWLAHLSFWLLLTCLAMGGGWLVR